MAEIALKIDDGANYIDGDVLCAFNSRRIRCVHAEHLTSPRQAGFTKDGLRPAGSLARQALEHTRQYRFDRLSKYVVRRTNLRDGKNEELSNTPNAKGEHMDVPLFLKRRKEHPRHSIFGLEGQEFWYGGRTYVANDDLDKVWLEIEARTPEREVNYTLWPAGSEDLKVHLFVAVDDFLDAVAEELVEPEMRDTGEVEEGMSGEEPTPIMEMVKRRKHNVEWEKLTGIDVSKAVEVRNKTQSIDIRAERIHDRQTIVKVKTAAVIEVIK